jgi:hypothetical protein
MRRGPYAHQDRGRANQSRRETHLWGLVVPDPEGPMPSEAADPRIATEQARSDVQGVDLQLCAPGRTRTCTLRIRSETPPVRPVTPERIAAGRVGFPVQLVASRPHRHNDGIANGIASLTSGQHQTESPGSTSARLHPLGRPMPPAGRPQPTAARRRRLNPVAAMPNDVQTYSQTEVEHRSAGRQGAEQLDDEDRQRCPWPSRQPLDRERCHRHGL